MHSTNASVELDIIYNENTKIEVNRLGIKPIARFSCNKKNIL